MELVGGYRDHGFDYSAANKAAQGSASVDAPSLKNMLLWGVVGVLVLLVVLLQSNEIFHLLISP